MAEVLARVAALGTSAAQRGGGYCALCFATRGERRLGSPRHLQRLVELLGAHMAHLGPVVSALTWGARACTWCEARCAGACRVLHALTAAATAHALLSQLDTGQDVANLEQQLAAAEEALRRARPPAHLCTDVLLIDTRQPVVELAESAACAGAPPRRATPADIETVVIEDDAPDPLQQEAPSALRQAARAPAAGPAPASALRPFTVSAHSAAQPGAPADATRLALTHKTFPVNNPKVTIPVRKSKLLSPVSDSSPKNANGAAQKAGAVNNVTAKVGEMVGNVFLVARSAGGPAPPAPAAPPGSDAVLMVLPPGAQIVSRLDGVGPKYLLLNSAAAAAPPATPAPPAPPAPPATLPGISAPPGVCTVSCDSDTDSSDSISLSQLIQRRDEFNSSFSMGDNQCFITDVKSLSEQKHNSPVNGAEQCYVVDVNSVNEQSVNNNNNHKRNSDATRRSKKAKGAAHSRGEGEGEARAPVALDAGRVDWEDKIPMDVISFVDATDPRADSFLPKLAPSGAANNCTARPRGSPAPGGAPHSPARAHCTAAHAHSPPRPLALISNVTSATGETSVVIDLC